MLDNKTETPLLEITDLCISYFTRAGEIPAVVDFSLTLHAGESVGLVGESGCGKSTVALAIMQYLGNNGGIVGGSIKFKGEELTTASPQELQAIRGADIAMVYQEPMAALNPSLTIGSQLIEVPMIHEGINRDEAWGRACTLLADVNLPDPERLMHAYPHQISGGQQQRVIIAMALLSNPSLLLLDEPTTALDVTVEAGIVDLVADLSRKYGTAILYISHNLGLILETCSQVGVMYSGEIVEQGEIAPLFANPRHPYTHGLFGCIPLPHADKNARPLTPIRGQLPLPHERPTGCNFGPRCDHFEAGLCDQGVIAMQSAESDHLDHLDRLDHRVRCVRHGQIDIATIQSESAGHAPEAPGEIILRVDDLKKYYSIGQSSLSAMISGKEVREVKANEALNFTARRGETVAIVGESGCGKSTFAKVLMGLETATSGGIELNGVDIGDQAVQDRTPGQLGSLQMVFQNPNDTLNPSHSIGGQIMRVIRKFGVETDKDKARELMLKLLDTVKLPRDFALRKPRQLSGGQKQRIGIARAFAGNPSVVIADEPVSALDVSVAAAVTELLMDIQREHKTTLLFISHDLSVVRYLADRVVVMYLGKIVESGNTEDVFAPPYHPYTEALLSAVPIADPTIEKRHIVLEGTLPSALNPPKGCPFASRCPRYLGSKCDDHMPAARTTGDNHIIACHIDIPELALIDPVIRQKDQVAETVT
jgi:peptide/nickel transport system ATP-binding protein